MQARLILVSSGLAPIESIAAGDGRYSFNPATQIVSQQILEETFIRESNELVRVTVGNETISGDV